MASGSTAMWGGLHHALLGLRCSCQASAKHFQQCAEFLPLRNGGLGPLRRDGIAHCAPQEGRRYLLRRRNVGASIWGNNRGSELLAGIQLSGGGAAMSLRAELVRLGLRWFVKRKIGPASTLEALRRQDAFLERLVPQPPKGTQATHIDLDGVKAVAVVTLASHRGRLVLYLHGGGHVSGSPALYGDFTWRIAAATRARTVILDHRLAPEHPFPAALDDAVTAYRALVADGADPGRMAVLGESSGGGLVLAMLLKLRDEGVRLPAAAVALSPWTDLALTGSSLQRNAEADPMLRGTEGARLASYYLAGADPRTPYASPLYADPTGLPPTLIQVGSDEILLDDSVRMAERMRAAGCQVELEIWPRMPHTWQVWARVLPEAQAAIERIGAFVQSKVEPQAAPLSAARPVATPPSEC